MITIKTIEEYVQWRAQWRKEYRALSDLIREAKTDHKALQRTYALRPYKFAPNYSAYQADEELEKALLEKWTDKNYKYAFFDHTRLSNKATEMLVDRANSKEQVRNLPRQE